MKKLEEFLQRFIGPIAEKMSNNDVIQSVAEGFMRTGPVTFGVCIFVILGNLPIDGYSDWLISIGMKAHFDAISNASLNVLALYISFTVAYAFAKRKGDNPLSCGVLSLLSFLLIIPQTVEGKDGVINAFNVTYLSGTGILVALIFAIITGYMFHFLSSKGLKFKMPEGVPPMVSNVFEGIIPFVIVAVLFMGVNYAFSLTSVECLHQAVYTLLQVPMQSLGGSIWAVLFIAFFAQVLWFFGIHGQNVLSPFYNPIWLALDAANLAAYSTGVAGPNIVGNAFYNIFCFGGYQIALCLLLLRARSKQFREFGKLGIGPAIFGIGEPLNFGMPLILNFKFIVPFLTNGVLMLAVAYLAIASGLVPHLNGTTFVFGLPFGIGAFLEGGWKVLALAIVVNIILPYFLWMPWVKMADKEAYQQEQGAHKE